MDRRRFLSVTAAALPGAAIAQAKARVHRVGFLGVEQDWPIAREAVQRLRELGYAEGGNLAIEYRHDPERPNKIPQIARELVRSRVELIMAWGILAVIGAQEATKSIPIVMVYGADPVALGYVKNLARPGGNMTGLGWGDEVQFVDKLVELFKSAMPAARSLGALWNLEDRAHKMYVDRIELAARGVGLRTVQAGIREREDIPAAFQQLKGSNAEAVIPMLDHLTINYQDVIQDQALAHRMPIVVPGGFGYKRAPLHYGPDVSEQPKRAAEYVARILGGARPGDLPVERSTRYELVVNLKAASDFGLAIPAHVLLRADRVIR